MTSHDADIETRIRPTPHAADTEPRVQWPVLAQPRDYSSHRVVGARHPGRLAGTVFAIAVIGIVLQSILTNPRWEMGRLCPVVLRRAGSSSAWGVRCF
jgi:polar amino acid transport system permease protein